jgi:hypothetical protein
LPLDHATQEIFARSGHITHREVAVGLVLSRDFALDLEVDKLGFVEAFLTGPLETVHPHLVTDMVADEVECA